jgi:S-formylglutathione hydrolase FrmB
LADPTRLRVLLPTGYNDQPTRRFPVLYLLHGGTADYRYWTDTADVTRIVGAAPLIVVMPDDGPGGWYTDWTNNGLGGPPEWETFHITQLIPWVDSTFRTRPDRSGRAIAGVSMGGFGAMSYATRHTQLFAAAASFSGAVDILDPRISLVVEVSPLATLTIPTSVFGPRLTNEPHWREHNPTDLADQLHDIDLAIYTGNGDPGPGDPPGPDLQEQAVHQASETFHHALTAAGIPHRFIDYGPGTHTTKYWQRDLTQELPHLIATLDPDATTKSPG